MESNRPTKNDGNETPPDPKTGGLPKPGTPGRGDGDGNETPPDPKTGGLPGQGGPGGAGAGSTTSGDPGA